jgi:hypothetical protein
VNRSKKTEVHIGLQQLYSSSSSISSSLFMGQDFTARKQAKKQRKRQARDAETGRKSKKRKVSAADSFGIAAVGEFMHSGPTDSLTASQAQDICCCHTDGQHMKQL